MKAELEAIVNLPHPSLEGFHRMSVEKRAAQFAPFAALTGYEESVEETARITQQRIQPDESEVASINEKLRYLHDHPEDAAPVSVTHFVKDPLKDGGAYHTSTGRVLKVDSYSRQIRMENGEWIAIPDIIAIQDV